MTLVIIRTTIERLEEKTRVKNAHKTPSGEIVSERESMGWFVFLKDSNVSLRIGDIPVDIEPGDPVTIYIGRQT